MESFAERALKQNTGQDGDGNRTYHCFSAGELKIALLKLITTCHVAVDGEKACPRQSSVLIPVKHRKYGGTGLTSYIFWLYNYDDGTAQCTNVPDMKHSQLNSIFI